MHNYVLTERGKFVVALLVAFALVLLSMILFVWALLTDDSNDLSETPGGTPGRVQVSPNPNDGISSPDPSLAGPVNFDIDAGEMSFIFKPEVQTYVDDRTASLIGDLLKSPKNTKDAKIAVEIPKLSDEDTSVLTNAVITAFARHGVAMSDIIFFVYAPGQNEEFTVKVSFQQFAQDAAFNYKVLYMS